MAYYSFVHTHVPRRANLVSTKTLLQFFEPGGVTVRVFSDGVPERDFQKEPARGSMR
jgi:hypothetical protein